MSENATPYTSIDENIFRTVQEQIEKDGVMRDSIREALKKLEKDVKHISSTLSRVHSITPSEVPGLVAKVAPSFKEAKDDLHELIKIVEPYPYYKYNGLWTMHLQNYTSQLLLSTWLERMYAKDAVAANALLTIDEVGEIMGVPVNVKTEDKFHLSIEEYLHAIITLVDELVRLTTNAVIQRDFTRPGQISTFVKDIFSSFQVLNLKNDSLRRRGDALKYNVKKVEDINYDLIVRNLVAGPGGEPKGGEASSSGDIKREE